MLVYALASLFPQLVTAYAAIMAPATRGTTPTLYLVGDSTMAFHPASEGIQGWGVELPLYLGGLTIVNRAASGRSARSYAREGRFYNVVQVLEAGDYVVIEFGHNDGRTPSTSDRAPVVGESLNATQTVTLFNGTIEVVHTFSWYLEGMISQVLAKGATPIVSSQTPNNPFENTATIVNNPPRFVQYAKDAAAATDVPYVDHFSEVISAYSKLGKAIVDSYYTKDHTHTNTDGAITVAEAFMSGLGRQNAKDVIPVPNTSRV